MYTIQNLTTILWIIINKHSIISPNNKVIYISPYSLREGYIQEITMKITNNSIVATDNVDKLKNNINDSITKANIAIHNTAQRLNNIDTRQVANKVITIGEVAIHKAVDTIKSIAKSEEVTQAKVNAVATVKIATKLVGSTVKFTTTSALKIISGVLGKVNSILSKVNDKLS